MAFIVYHYHEYLPVHYTDVLIYNQMAAEDILALRDIFWIDPWGRGTEDAKQKTEETNILPSDHIAV